MTMTKAILVVLLIAGIVAADYPSSSGYDKYDAYPSYDRDYKFNYDVKDDYTYNYQSRDEKKYGKTVVGSYSLMDPDGKLRVVKYEADDDGFRAYVDRGDEKMSFPATDDSYSSYKPSYSSYKPTSYSAPPYKASPAYAVPSYKPASYSSTPGYKPSSYKKPSSSSTYKPRYSYKAPIYSIPKAPVYSSYKAPSYPSYASEEDYY